jgi:hypothetical protein
MNVFTNEEYFAAQTRKARLLRSGGVLAIIFSFVMSLLTNYNPYLVCAAYPFLLAGLPMWSIGRSMQRKLTTMPRPDKLLNEELKGLSNKYSLHHYPVIDGRLVKHLLVMPAGLLAIESRDSTGPIGCTAGKNGDAWRAKSGLMDRISGMNPSVGNPTADLAVSIQSVTTLLPKIGKEAVPVMGMIVFTRNPDINVDGCTYAALPLDELKETVRDLQFELGSDKGEGGSVETILTTEDRRKLNAILQPSAPPTQAPPARETARRGVGAKPTLPEKPVRLRVKPRDPMQSAADNKR